MKYPQITSSATVSTGNCGGCFFTSFDAYIHKIRKGVKKYVVNIRAVPQDSQFKHIVCIYADRRPALQTARRGDPNPHQFEEYNQRFTEKKREIPKTGRKTQLIAMRFTESNYNAIKRKSEYPQLMIIMAYCLIRQPKAESQSMYRKRW